MKKTSVRKKRESPQDTLRSEYRFDYGKSKPNRFAAKMSQGTVARYRNERRSRLNSAARIRV